MDEIFKTEQIIKDNNLLKLQVFYWQKNDLSIEQKQFLDEIVNEFKLAS